MVSDDAQMDFRMAGFQRENLIRGYQSTKQLCLPMDCVFMCFDLTPMLPVRKVYFSIQSLDFQTIYKTVNRTVINRS
jgi:hypothetical protein